MGDGTGGAVLVHVGTNNAEKEGTSAIVQEICQDTLRGKDWTDCAVEDITSNGRQG